MLHTDSIRGNKHFKSFIDIKLEGSAAIGVSFVAAALTVITLTRPDVRKFASGIILTGIGVNIAREGLDVVKDSLFLTNKKKGVG